MGEEFRGEGGETWSQYSYHFYYFNARQSGDEKEWSWFWATSCSLFLSSCSSLLFSFKLYPCLLTAEVEEYRTQHDTAPSYWYFHFKLWTQPISTAFPILEYPLEISKSRPPNISSIARLGTRTPAMQSARRDLREQQYNMPSKHRVFSSWDQSDEESKNAEVPSPYTHPT